MAAQTPRIRIPIRGSRLRRPVAVALTALTAAALALPMLSACSAVDKARDCADTATAVVNAVDKLQQAAGNSLDDPKKAERALDDIDRNLKKVRDTTDDADLSAAIDRMNTGIRNARTSLKNAKAPDLKPITDAAGAMTKTCTPG
ncbi:hypothetical protein [Streptomyces gilvosporeus]|uniref:Secreted protein n=1 Tax=Streptomyces gilvosporeus TaxID=553510 RepID=A0A1V0TRB8_9ACTN|nr:hypothetical protein [Streptomyces gilvosporeus]ARF55495.1 hypothetical protein B1H19_16100 [Streptomyces gilvosporeus]